jgi:hypothetical protein
MVAVAAWRGDNGSMAYDAIDPRRIRTWPLAERNSLIEIERVALDPTVAPPEAGALGPQLDRLAERIAGARRNNASVMLAFGAHLIKNGGGPLLNWLVANGWVTHVATQGAGIIHDWEFAFTGLSSESVRENAPAGRFGCWDETGRCINLAVLAGAAEGLGFGEAVGRFIENDGVDLPTADEILGLVHANPATPLAAANMDLLAAMRDFGIPPGQYEVRHPFKQYSVPACCYRHRVPLTAHPGIGYDIFTNHPMFSGAAVGRTAGTDTRIFTESVRKLEGGVYLSVGSAIMSPQVFEKAFAVANNLREQDGERSLRDHFIAVVDIQDGGGWDWTTGEPPQNHPAYYLRFCKSFHRMGGTVDYLRGDNRLVLANLIARLR